MFNFFLLLFPTQSYRTIDRPDRSEVYRGLLHFHAFRLSPSTDGMREKKTQQNYELFYKPYIFKLKSPLKIFFLYKTSSRKNKTKLNWNTQLARLFVSVFLLGFMASKNICLLNDNSVFNRTSTSRSDVISTHVLY